MFYEASLQRSQILRLLESFFQPEKAKRIFLQYKLCTEIYRELKKKGKSLTQLAEYDAVAFGCPAMGDEVLEESSFDPMFTGIVSALSGKRIALFGSYGWGDGQWMRDWEQRCKDAGVILVCDSVTANSAPDEAALEACRDLGAALC